MPMLAPAGGAILKQQAQTLQEGERLPGIFLPHECFRFAQGTADQE